MLFKAQLEDREFQIEVKEFKDSWTVSISKKEEKTPKKYQIMKCDYQKIGHIVSFLFKNKSYMAYIENGIQCSVTLQGADKQMILYNEETALQQSLKEGGLLHYGHTLTANMPGKIVEILVKPGDKVIEGQPILIMESMKMENEMRSSSNTTIKSIKVKKGENVEAGAVLMTFAK